jgi:hypothetical protein
MTHHENVTLICDKLKMLSTSVLHAGREFGPDERCGLSRMLNEMVEDLQPTVEYLHEADA